MLLTLSRMIADTPAKYLKKKKKFVSYGHISLSALRAPLSFCPLPCFSGPYYGRKSKKKKIFKKKKKPLPS